MSDVAAPRGDTEVGAVAAGGVVLALGSVAGRVTGYLRTAVLGAALGAGAVNNAYTTANTIPSMVYELLLGGVLSGVLVPLLVRARENDADRGAAYAQRLLSLATVFLGAATVVAVICAPLLVSLVIDPAAPAPERRLTTVLIYLLLPEIFCYGLAAMFSAVIYTGGRFAAPAWTPVVNNVIVIVTAVVVLALAPGTVPTPTTISPAQVAVLGIGTTLGIVGQAAGLLPALRAVGFRWRWRFDVRGVGLGELGRLSGWVLCYVVANQVGVVVVLRLANAAANQQGAGPAIYNNGFLLLMMAHGIVTISVVTALLPRVSAAAAQHDYRAVAGHLSLGIRLSAVVIVPATAVFGIFADELATLLFRYGNYTAADATSTAIVIRAAALCLLPFLISQAQLFAFYALPDARTPALINLPSVAVRLAVQFLLVAVVPASLAAAGLMVGNAISWIVASVLGGWFLRRRLGALGLPRIVGSLGRLAVAGLVGGVVAGLVAVPLRGLGDGHAAAAVTLVVGSLVFVAVYLGVAAALRVDEVAALFRVRRPGRR